MISKNYPGFIRSYRKTFVSVCFICLLLSSCITQRKLQYLQDKDTDVKSFKESELTEYRLKPNDELYIQVTSQDEAAANVFSNSGSETSYVATIDPYGASLLSYTVDKDGYLLVPVVGRLLVKDRTIPEVSGILKDSLTHILNQPVVTVKLVNRYISVLGEVRNPGHYSYSQQKLTIYDAIGMAGDLTDFGNRLQVILIRNVDGENIRVNLNLTKSDILTSEYYNIKPNDIIYVKQLRQKFWNISEIPITIFLSATTTALLIYSIVM